MTKRNGFKPTFYVVIDRRCIESNLEDIRKYKCKKFIPVLEKHYFSKDADVLPIPLNARFYHYGLVSFSSDCSKSIFSGLTVTYACIQLAFYMGFSKIYLIGMDFHYKKPKNVKIQDDVWVSTGSDDPNNFDPSYNSGYGKIMGIPRLDKVVLAYNLARKVADKTGISIYNATPGGKLENFERVDYNSLFL